MAFVSRSMRATGTLEPTATNELVGPGSYGGHGEHRRGHSYAPFASTQEREGAFGSSNVPGPGAYTKLNFTTKKEATHSSFTSRVARLADNNKGDSPGPGTYVEKNEWIKRSNRQLNIEGPARRITFQRMPTAPSVPCKHQSYGYEEGEAGELIMQGASEVGHTGAKGDTVGPAKYTPNLEAIKGRKVVDFSRSRSTRNLFTSVDGPPGPGTYTPAGNIADKLHDPEMLDPLNPNLPSSSFASRVPLKHQELMEEEHLLPGPGSYGARSVFRKQYVPEAHQFFGSTQMRPYQLDMPRMRSGPTSLMTPGPGAYNERRNNFQDKKGGHDAPPFASTQLRFEMSKEAMERPGPGTYDEYDELTFVSEIGKKLVSRSGIFGSSQKRFQGSRPEKASLFGNNEEAPGPTSYDKGMDMADPTNLKRPSPAFASNSQRFSRTAPADPQRVPHKPRLASQVQLPAPGQYDVTKPWIKKNLGAHRSGHFISQEDRFPANQAVPGERYSIAPGPGQYTVKKLQKPVHTFKSFGSNSSRFTPATTVAPGPGTYESGADGPHGLVKRSFNVTIDGVEF